MIFHRNGLVHEYKVNGVLVNSYQVGIIPGNLHSSE